MGSAFVTEPAAWFSTVVDEPIVMFVLRCGEATYLGPRLRESIRRSS
jgi:hypothetical protein